MLKLFIVSIFSTSAIAYESSELALLPPEPIRMIEVKVPETLLSLPQPAPKCIGANSWNAVTGLACVVGQRYVYIDLPNTQRATVGLEDALSTIDLMSRNSSYSDRYTRSKVSKLKPNTFLYKSQNSNDQVELSIESPDAAPFLYAKMRLNKDHGICQAVRLGSKNECYAFAGPTPRIPIETTMPDPSRLKTLRFTEIIKRDLRWKDFCHHNEKERACLMTYLSAVRFCASQGMRIPTFRELVLLSTMKGVVADNVKRDGLSCQEGINSDGRGDRICYDTSKLNDGSSEYFAWSSTSYERKYDDRYLYVLNANGTMRYNETFNWRTESVAVRCIAD